MKKKTLSNKEIRELNEQVQKYSFQFDKKGFVEVAEDGKYKVVKSNNKAVFFYYDGEIIPSLKLVLDGKIVLKKITVDMGAVRFVVNGADVMRPGIIEIENGIEKDEVIAIVDVNNKKPLAVGKALISGLEMKQTESGKVVKNLHFIGDGIWQF